MIIEEIHLKTWRLSYGRLCIIHRYMDNKSGIINILNQKMFNHCCATIDTPCSVKSYKETVRPNLILHGIKRIYIDDELDFELPDNINETKMDEYLRKLL